MNKENWFTGEKVVVREKHKCKRKDCLINTDGYCTALSVVNRKCRFYKSEKFFDLF